VTRTPLSRSKGQRSTCGGGGTLWRPRAQLVKRHLFQIVAGFRTLTLHRVE